MHTRPRDGRDRPFACGNGREEARPFKLGSPNLQMQVARPAQRPGAEERSPEIGTPAALARQHAVRRVLERPVRGVEHARTVERLVGVWSPLDVQLVARCAIERVLLVRANLRLDVEGA